LPTIEIDGDTMSELGYNEGPGGVSPPSNSGTVIYAMAEPTGSQPSVIGGPTAVSGGHNNNLSVVMKNIGIRTRSNSYSAEDFGWEGNAIVENSTIEVNAAGLSGDAAQPTAANGIILPYSNNDGMVIVRDSFITGYYTGIVASEHALLQNDFLQQMPVCLSMGGGGHLLEIDHSLFQWCPIYIQSVAGSVQDISGILDVEDASSGHWYSPAAAQIISANAGNLCGNLSIEHNEEGVGRLTTLLTTNANVTSCFQQALLDTGSQNVNNLGVFGQATFTPSAGYATTGAGQLGYDSTSNNWHVYDNGADRVMAPLAPGFTSGDCGEPIATGGSWLIADAGAPCGSSSGGGLADPGSNGIVYRSALNITTPATSAEMQTAIGANVYAAAPVLSYNGGDLLCAHAGDLTILSNAITAGTATNLTVASLPSNLKIPGTLVGVTGATSNGGTLNGGPYAITSVSSSTMNFASLPATWSSGGTIYLWCSNQSTDDIASAQYFTNNTYAATLSAGQSLSQDYQVNTYTTATAPTYTIDYEMGSTLLYGSGAQTLSASAGGQNVPGDIKFNLISPATGWTSTTLDHLLLGQNTPTSKIYAGNFLNNIATGALKLGGFFSATGLGSITSGSGGTISGTGTCMLGTFNDSLTGATATVTFVTSGSWTGATFAVTNTGYGATAAPTSATLASGTATCSGTPTLVTVLGGAQGNAVQLQTVKITQ
jgi:hypothetical protein